MARRHLFSCFLSVALRYKTGDRKIFSFLRRFQAQIQQREILVFRAPSDLMNKGGGALCPA
jgi:hypothetical protein